MSENDNTKTGIRKHFNEEGSQSKPVVLAASLFMAAFSLTCLYLAFKGPDKEGVFFFLRLGVFFYPLMIGGVILFARIAFIGFKRVKTM